MRLFSRRSGSRPNFKQSSAETTHIARGPRWVNAHIRSKGKNCRIWSGFEHMRGTTEIDPSVIIDMWETDNAKGQIAKGHAIINSNHGRTYIVPGAHYYDVSNSGIYNSWEPWMVSGDMAKNPAKDDPKLLGGKLHIWNDQGPTGYTHNEIARLALPSIQVFAEKLWGTKGSKDFLEFQKRAEVVSTVPGVNVVNRAVKPKSSGGLVLNLPIEWGFKNRFDHRLNEVAWDETGEDEGSPVMAVNKGHCNLEYPWTVSVEVNKTVESGARGVLFSSDLAEICTDYSRTEERTQQDAKGENVKKKVARRGIGVIRAAGTPGTVPKTSRTDPALSHLVNDVSRVYSDPLPLNKWTTITIIGQQRRTTVYVDGQKVGESGEQMLCPLKYFGSFDLGQSFVGKIRNLKVYDRALTPKEIGRAAGLENPDNLAAHCRVTASASDTAYGFTPDKITDEQLGTRWSSGPTGAEQWVAIDLGKAVEFDTLSVAWEAARPKKLRIQIPLDKGDSPIFADPLRGYPAKIGTVPAQGQDKWKDVCDIDVSGEKTVAAFPAVQAARVRLVMSQPATQWGYSIWEVEVLKKPLTEKQGTERWE